LTDAGRDEKKLTKAIEDAKTWDIDVQNAEAILKELQEARAKEQARLEEEARIRDEANIEFIKSLPQGELTSTGQLVPTYSWVQVPSVASLPQGMEVWMLGGLKCARIPVSWRLQIVAEGQVIAIALTSGRTRLFLMCSLGQLQDLVGKYKTCNFNVMASPSIVTARPRLAAPGFLG